MGENAQTVAFLVWLYQEALNELAARAARSGHIVLPTLAVTPTELGYRIAIEIQLSTKTAAALVADELTV